MNKLAEFFYMHGYGIYIWPAYGSVVAMLLIQWIIPWVRWKKHLHKQKKKYE